MCEVTQMYSHYEHMKMLVIQCNCASAAWLHRITGLGYQKADDYLTRMEREGIVYRDAAGRRRIKRRKDGGKA